MKTNLFKVRCNQNKKKKNEQNQVNKADFLFLQLLFQKKKPLHL